jgi:hypothetical protein
MLTTAVHFFIFISQLQSLQKYRLFPILPTLVLLQFGHSTAITSSSAAYTLKLSKGNITPPVISFIPV